tara:strand:+ start:141 stop:485 length:345 start_codon:yes stop_codon:yes gene_type:complete
MSKIEIGFNDSYKSDGFEEGIEFINKLLKPYDLKIKGTFIEEDNGIDEYMWEIKMEELESKPIFIKLMWSLYKNTDKGWQIEGTYNSKKEAEYYLEEWQEEFPNCKFKIEENVK